MEYFSKQKTVKSGFRASCKECNGISFSQKNFLSDVKPNQKRCKLCKLIFEKSNLCFFTNIKSKDGFSSKCKSCAKIKYDVTGEGRKKKTESSMSKEARREYDHNRYWNNKEEIALKRKIRKENGYKYFSEKEKKLKVIRNQKRRATLKNLPNSFTLEQWEFCKNSFDNKCCYCGKKEPLQQEHFIPVSKMGHFAINNILPACGSCNIKKNNGDFFYWYPRQSFYSKQREIKILNYLNNISEMKQISS